MYNRVNWAAKIIHNLFTWESFTHLLPMLATMSVFGYMTVNDVLYLVFIAAGRCSMTALWPCTKETHERMILLRLEETKLRFSFYALKHTYFILNHMQKKLSGKIVYLKHKYTHSC